MESEIIEIIDTNIRDEQDKMEICLDLLNEEIDVSKRAKLLRSWFNCKEHINELIKEKRMFDYYR